jgi:hypothetical protein
MLLSLLCALARLHEKGQIEAKSAPGSPGAPTETKLKQGKKRNLTTAGKGSKLGSEPAPDAAEFMSLPPQIREQLLRYGARWTEAMFRPVLSEVEGLRTKTE